MPGGYAGRILEVDLGRREVKASDLPSSYEQAYLGGFGINNRLFLDHSRPGTDPLSPENPLILGAGPFVGTLVPGASRVMANARFPLTGAVASASGSMGLGANLKWAGWDHLVILGRSPGPVALVVEDERVEFVPAGGLWGKGILETTRSLWDRYPGFSVLAIGPAGENLVHSSLAMIDASATLGRGGLGAVMGSKNLKAVLVKGNGAVRIADPAGLHALVRDLFRRLERYELREAAAELGMIGAWPMYAAQLLPHGATERDLEEANERFGPQAYLRLKKRRLSCPSCFLPDKDELLLPSSGRTVYSTSFLNAAILGCALGMKDAEEAASTLALLDDLGLDFMTLSWQAAYLLELGEHGIIKGGEAEGIPLARGADILRELAWRVTEGRGDIGKALAAGWKGTLAWFGEHTRRYTMLVRDQDCLYDPRVSGLGTMEFEQVVSPRGPTSASAGSATYVPSLPEERLRRLTERMGVPEDALERIFSPPWRLDVGRLTRYSEDWFSLFSSLGICNRFQVNRFYHAALIRDLLAAVTGMELSVEEMMARAAASWELYRELNAREGLGPEEDRPPEAWFHEEPLWGRGGRLHDYFGNPLTREDVNLLLHSYYDERGVRS
ncbi:aldehyde ferredoxin oxidoreductase N-terminal domain-containing protein [Candidatus Solincola sp.]|nr:aldehyde ferredoxin oxidoreductase N-terminal domain-containing protein [Actinomycetota bacterium]MDI7252756.1 aldehyde ferredoxin oxidoreductase N-terminal domain-containing protein [Actinomycetota bacterium]